jgi:diguanylate cyclase (GGDEF)-like protein
VGREGVNGIEGLQAGHAGRLALEIAGMQAELLEKLRGGMSASDLDAFAGAARRIAEAFGNATAAVVDPLSVDQAGALRAEPRAEIEGAPPTAAHPSLFHPGQMRRRLDQLIETHRRYGHPFCLAIFDVDGPGARNGDGSGSEAALAVLGAALRESVRLVDETYALEEEALCVLAPEQNTVGGVQMTERLLGALADLEAAGGLPIGISAGVVACPEHGLGAEELLQSADEAMWRARAVGQPVGVGRLQDR